MRSAVKIALAVALVLIAQQMALGSSIITMPTADVAPVGAANVATYVVNFDGMPEGAPTGMNVHILYAGIARNLEVEANVYDVNKSGPRQDFFVLTYKAMDETATMPQISVGVKNPFGEILGNDDDPLDDSPTYFVAAVKTLMAPAPGEPFTPVVRLHAGLGTNYHEGIFGGIQALLTPKLGVAALHDANDMLFAATYKPSEKLPTFKAGTLGDHTWFGLDYDLRF